VPEGNLPYDPAASTGCATETYSPANTQLMRLQLEKLTAILDLGLANAPDEAAFRELVGLGLLSISDDLLALGTIVQKLGALETDLRAIRNDVADIKSFDESIKTDVAAIKASADTLVEDVGLIKPNVSEIAADTSSILAEVTEITPLVTTMESTIVEIAADTTTMVAVQAEMAADLVEVSASADAIVASTASSAATAIAFQGEWAFFYSAAIGTGIVVPGSGINVELVSLGHSAPADLAAIDYKTVNGSTPLHVTVDGLPTNPATPTPVSLTGPVSIRGIEVDNYNYPPDSNQYVTIHGERVGGKGTLITQVQGSVGANIIGSTVPIDVRTNSSGYVRVYHGGPTPDTESAMPINGSVTISTAGTNLPVDIQATGGHSLRVSASGDPVVPVLGHMVSLTSPGHPIGALGGPGSGIGTDPGTVVTAVSTWPGPP
jgi:hypothetical protein